MSTSLGRVRVFLATSLDGYIAGEGDDLSWLPDPSPHEEPPDDAVTWEGLMADTGALLMGRRTYDVVRGFDVDWPYGDRPVLVATHRGLDAAPPPGASPVSGPIEDMVASARDAAAGRDVYIDGGNLIRQACEAGLVDELVISLVPTALGGGHSLFTGLASQYRMRLEGVVAYPAGMVQLRLTPER